MKTVVYTLAICAVTLVSIVYLLQDSISQMLLTAKCTDFEFYHVKVKICDDTTAQNLKLESQEIAKAISNLEDEYASLAESNESLKKSLSNCKTSVQAKKAINKSDENKEKFEVLKPQFNIYKQPIDFDIHNIARQTIPGGR